MPSSERDGVLDRDDEDLHHEAEAEAEDDHVAGDGPGSGGDADRGHQVETDGHEGGADDREDLVAPPAAHDLARSDRRDQQTEHHREQPHARGGRADPLHLLEEEREEGQRAEHGEPDDEPDRARGAEHRVGEEAQWDDRFLRPSLGKDEGDAEDHTGDREPDHERGAPGVGGPPEAGEEHQRGGGEGEEHRPQVVDDPVHPAERSGKRDRGHHEGGRCRSGC